ncbi:peptide synthase [Gordonia pseudamarae]|jgi:hypothetical protein|uniref:Peptide synthase n=1 Tax=Gordonia pseudamarae TaxID=2831662 RepID=A0ABX6IG29_9ACTN|nr:MULTISPECIES: condensation domain-containing protein [Gordonia]MBD0021549.1 peptide synthase [Gordonia sp. (in: high G+C Gram-positive bacteria)]QHN25159.1 peptide synthase [Gordonia pseudamarae]QHN34091.1 peptide synthase [Gordonia pseudamarae]
MKFTELSDYPLPAGTVTEWSPYTVTPESEWAIDLRPATFDHDLHLRRSVGDEAGNSWLGSVFEIDRRYDPVAFETTLRLWTARHEVLRSTVVVDSSPVGPGGCLPGPDTHTGRLSRRHTHPAEAVAIGSHAVGRLTEEAIGPHLARLFDRDLSPLVWPHYRTVTITDLEAGAGGPGRFAVVLAADHCVVDAYSLLVAMHEIRSLYLAEADGTDAALPGTGSHLDYGVHDHTMGAELTPMHPAVTHWRGFLAASGWQFPAFGLASAQPHLGMPDEHDTAAQPGRSEFVMTADSAAEVNQLCRAAGHSMQTTVITALALAHRAVTGERRMRAAMPMHTRHRPEYVDAIGWFVGLGPLDIDLDSAETFAEAMDVTVLAIEAAKAVSRYPYPRIAELIGCSAVPEFVISYLDVRYVPGAADWPLMKARTVRGRTESDREVYLWVARSPDGITVSTRHPGNRAAATAISDFVDTAVSIISRVTTDGMGLRLDSLTAHRLPA